MSAFYGTESRVPSALPGAEPVPDNLLPVAEAAAAEGVDLSSIGSEDELYAALQEAVRRRDVLLFSPSGRDRELALGVLKEFAELVDAHRMGAARELLASVLSAADEQSPAAAQVTGAGASLLDSLAGDAAHKAAARNTKLTKWGKPGTKAAREVLDAALKQGAFVRLQELSEKHAAEALVEGVAVAVASLLASIARKQKSTVSKLTTTFLADAAEPIKRQASSNQPAGEAAASEKATAAAPEAPTPASTAAESSQSAPDDAQEAALRETPVVAGIAQLLEWVGDGKPVTASGQLRRADIEPVAAMLGLNAVGVAKRPADEDNGALSDAANPLQVRSAADVAALSLWWDVLDRGEVLEISKTRVQAGVAASKYGAAALVEDLEKFVAVYVLWSMNTLLVAEAAASKAAKVPAVEVAKQIGSQLVSAANAADPVGFDAAGVVAQAESAELSTAAAEVLGSLADVRLLGQDAAGTLSIPLGLRNAVLNGVSGMKAYAPEAFGSLGL